MIKITHKLKVTEVGEGTEVQLQSKVETNDGGTDALELGVLIVSLSEKLKEILGNDTDKFNRCLEASAVILKEKENQYK